MERHAKNDGSASIGLPKLNAGNILRRSLAIAEVVATLVADHSPRGGKHVGGESDPDDWDEGQESSRFRKRRLVIW